MKTFFLAVSLFFSSLLFAGGAPDEGMWLPKLIGKNAKEMKKMGARLSADALYHDSRPSVKDAIVWFNGGCTGEIVSPEGLLLTNHHCGYGAIVKHSSPENNIHDKGWYAATRADEKPNPGMWVSILVKMDDVTEAVFAAAGELTGSARQAAIAAEIRKISSKAIEGTHYEAFVREAYQGNAYHLYVMERFNDIRLVGTPPNTVGGFGGDTDNWEWPRHSGDFSMFRIYAGKDNKPASYSPDNVPYKPRHYLPVSLKGVEEGDFTMVYGFPGSTNRYETSFGVKQASDIVNPAIVALREMRLNHWKAEMDKDEAVRLKLASSYAGIANYWKYYIGQTEQLLRRKVYEQKQEKEAAFARHFASDTAMLSILPAMSEAYKAIEPYALHQVYMSQGLSASSLLTAARNFAQLLPLLSATDSSQRSQAVNRIAALRASLQTSAHLPSDLRITASFLEMYYRNIPSDQHPAYFAGLVGSWQHHESVDFAHYAELLYSQSILTNEELFAAFTRQPSTAVLENDPAYRLVSALTTHYSQKYLPLFDRFQRVMAPLRTRFVKGKLLMAEGTKTYPDANSTLRISYGTVSGYNPRDAVSFTYKTTLDGVMEKEKPGDEEFDVPTGMKSLYEQRNFGPYAGKEKMLPVNFLTNNDITGGNSGSPVLNARGELLGLAFDGNWEAMSGDIAFDSRFKRCINVDIRYVLFLIDTFGGARHLIEEMDLVD